MDGMKPGIRQLGPATLKLRYSPLMPANMRSSLLEVHDLFVPETERRQGHASRLMMKTCAEADQAQKVLMLLPDSEQLADWYLTFGFQLIQKTPMLMARHINADPLVKLSPVGVAAMSH